LGAVTDQVATNLTAAFIEHESKLDAVRAAGVKWYGFELAPMIVSATVGIVGAATGNVPMTVAGTVLGTVGVPALKEVLRHGKEIWSSYQYAQRSAAGISEECPALRSHVNAT
jgi:hypothetical protein